MDAFSFADGHDGSLFRPSRMNYPGSRSGPKTRYDLPQRHRAYGNGDQVDAILFDGTSLQPQAWKPHVNLERPLSGAGSTSLFPARTTPRDAAVLSDCARCVLQPLTDKTSGRDLVGLEDCDRARYHPLSERNLPELPLIDEKNDVHGCVVLGGKEVGKTTLIMSLLAVTNGKYPSKKDAEIEERKQNMPAFGQSYEFPERDVRLGSGDVRSMRLILTDTPPCGTNSREEQPLCATVSPNSTQHFSAIPSWMRVTMRGGNLPHYAALFVIDALALPLWEDSARCRDLARLLAVLKRNQYTVVIAVTKLFKARKIALHEAAHGADHKGSVGKDPHSSYETFVSRYLEKVSACIQAKAYENDWSFSKGPDCPSFPLLNSTIFDAPTWIGPGDYKSWQAKRGTPALPNFRYMESQLQRIITALSIRSHPDL
jgi:hypothetical protein